MVILKGCRPATENGPRRFLRSRIFKALIAVFVVVAAVSGSVVTHYYNRYARMIDTRLDGQVFHNTAKIYAGSSKLVTSLSDSVRVKRRLVTFKDIPKVLVDAVTA